MMTIFACQCISQADACVDNKKYKVGNELQKAMECFAVIENTDVFPSATKYNYWEN